MNSIRCPNCDLVSFANATECKRCQAKFLAPPDATAMAMPTTPYSFNQNAALPAQPVQFEPLPEFEMKAPPIGGWLIVFAIGLGVSLGLCGLLLPEYIKFMSSPAYQMLTTPGAELYVSSFSAGFNLELIWLVVSSSGSILLLLRMFRKSSSFPSLATFILAAHIVVASIDFLMAINIEHQLREKLVALYGASKVPPLLPAYMSMYIAYAILSSIAWILYLKNSRRVESTFIN